MFQISFIVLSHKQSSLPGVYTHTDPRYQFHICAGMGARW